VSQAPNRFATNSQLFEETRPNPNCKLPTTGTNKTRPQRDPFGMNRQACDLRDSNRRRATRVVKRYGNNAGGRWSRLLIADPFAKEERFGNEKMAAQRVSLGGLDSSSDLPSGRSKSCSMRCHNCTGRLCRRRIRSHRRCTLHRYTCRRNTNRAVPPSRMP
jgi:hypothetical protein